MEVTKMFFPFCATECAEVISSKVFFRRSCSLLCGNVKVETLCKNVDLISTVFITHKGSDEEFTDMNRKIPIVFKH